MSTDSYERNASPLLCDPQPISVSLPSDSDSYAEILLGLRRCFPPEPVAAVREINAKILAAAAAREAMVADGKERRSGFSPLSEASAATLQLTDLELPVAVRADSGNGEVRVPETGGSRRGRKRRTDQEQEEYWSRRPDWLPEGWTAEVKVRANGATAGTRDRYYYDPKSGHRFRSRKEVEKFTRTGEIPKNKSKPKTEDSNVVYTPSQSSRPPQRCSSGGISVPYVADEDVPEPSEYSSKSLPSFKNGAVNSCNIEAEGSARMNQQPEVRAKVIGQYETEETIGIQQSVPFNIAGLGTIKGTERTRQSEIGEDNGVQKSKSSKKVNWKKAARGGRIIQQSELEKEAIGVQQEKIEKEEIGVEQFETGKKAKRSKQSAHSNISVHETSLSRTKKYPKVDRGILIHLGREIFKRAILANSESRTSNHFQNQ